MKARKLLFLASLLSFGCVNPSSAGYDVVGIRASQYLEDSSLGPPIDHCIVLPLLLGSRIEEEFRITRSLSIHLSATRDDLTLRSEGAAEDGTRTYRVEDLESGFGDDFELTEVNGDSFLVEVQAGCFPDP